MSPPPLPFFFAPRLSCSLSSPPPPPPLYSARLYGFMLFRLLTGCHRSLHYCHRSSRLHLSRDADSPLRGDPDIDASRSGRSYSQSQCRCESANLDDNFRHYVRVRAGHLLLKKSKY